MQGIIYLIPKSNETNKPKIFRPMISTYFVQIFNIHSYKKIIHTNNILPAEQKGYRKRFCGCTNQLLIKKMLLENNPSNHINLTAAGLIAEKLLTAYHTYGS